MKSVHTTMLPERDLMGSMQIGWKSDVVDGTSMRFQDGCNISGRRGLREAEQQENYVSSD